MHFLSPLSDLLFPPSCVHCHDRNTASILCSHCSSQLHLVDPSTRCPLCFSDAISKAHSICDECRQPDPKKMRITDYVGACFDYAGPVETLLHEYKFGNSPFLAKSFGSFLYLQFVALGWPLPDVVTYVPQSFFRFVQRGYNQSELMANYLAQHLERPCVNLIRKRESTISQTQIARKMRESLSSTLFCATRTAIKTKLIEDKVILLIDDVYTTGTTIQRAALALQAEYPKRIYVLTLCRS